MARRSHKNVGLIGLGIIGSRVAACLRSAGFHTYVWNRSPRAEPNFLGNAAEVAEVCSTIQLFVPDAQALFETVDALADRLTPSHIILCNATVGPEATVEAARLVRKCGAKFLDAPFTGSKGAAEKGQLVYYIGGDDDVLRQVEPVLQASSKAIVKIGEIGAAATVKIATNMMGAVAVQSVAEALALLKGSGIDPEILVAALEHHGARSPLVDLKLPIMLRGDFAPHFSVKHMFKDVQIGIHIANSMDMDLPATTAAAGVLYEGMHRGWGELDFSAVVKVYDGPQKDAPLQLREPPPANALPAPEPPPAPPSEPSKTDPANQGDSAPEPPDAEKKDEKKDEKAPAEPTQAEKPAEPEKPSEPAKLVEFEKALEPEKPLAGEKPLDSEKPPASEEPLEPEPSAETRPKGFGWLFGKK